MSDARETPAADARAGEPSVPEIEGSAVPAEPASTQVDGVGADEEPVERRGAGLETARRLGYEPVIGLEVHVQLRTDSKIFCACATTFGAPPNTQVCPVCLGFPGTLPVLNGRAIELAVRAALALNCTVHERSVFARKNYFYPDLPKGYQISQFDRPLATRGWLELRDGGRDGHADAERIDDGAAPAGENGGRPMEAEAVDGWRVRITRLHLEEDAGKSFHGAAADGGTALDFNRCGVPLVEIVSEPDLRTPGEAYLYLSRLKQLLRYVGVSDVNMEEGSLRCDANVSVRPAGSAALGTKTEIKNLNSFRNVERALDFEIGRQVETLAAGGVVAHETRLWDAAKGRARPMRSKELSHDYRYFPEPDLGPLVLETAEIEAWRRDLPELPDARLQRFAAEYGLPAYDAGVLTASRELADWYEAAARAYAGPAKEVSNWVMGEVMRVLNERGIEADALPVGGHALAELLALKDEGRITGRTAKVIFERMLETGKTPSQILDEENLGQISDADELGRLAAAVLDERPTEVAAYLGGRRQLLSFFIGEVMKKTRGRANPKSAGALLADLLERRRAGAELGETAEAGGAAPAEETGGAAAHVPEAVVAALAEIPGTPESHTAPDATESTATAADAQDVGEIAPTDDAGASERPTGGGERSAPGEEGRDAGAPGPRSAE